LNHYVVSNCIRPDGEQLAHASAEGRFLYTFNVGDFMRLHGEYAAAVRAHAGIIVGEQMRRLRRIIALR
jgi:hypothetical protein